MDVNKIEQGQGLKFPRGRNVRSDSTKRISDDEEDGEVERVTRLSSTTGSPVESVATDIANVNTNGLRGWQKSSRIIRVSRASDSKDRHRKVLTSKGLRDRRVTLSVHTAIQFYDVQDRFGYDRPSKAVEWLIKAADGVIAELPSLKSPFPDTHLSNDVELATYFQQSQSQRLCLSKFACSSTS